MRGKHTVMTEDIASKTGLIGPASPGMTLSPSAIVGLMLEIQSSLLESPEHAHLSEAAEDLLLALVRSIKNAEAVNAVGSDNPGHGAAPFSGARGKPQLRIVEEA